MVLSMSSAVVSTAPTSTTNITGFLTMPAWIELADRVHKRLGHDFRVPKTFLGSHNSPFLMLVLSEPVKNLVIEGYGPNLVPFKQRVRSTNP